MNRRTGSGFPGPVRHSRRSPRARRAEAASLDIEVPLGLTNGADINGPGSRSAFGATGERERFPGFTRSCEPSVGCSHGARDGGHSRVCKYASKVRPYPHWRSALSRTRTVERDDRRGMADPNSRRGSAYSSPRFKPGWAARTIVELDRTNEATSGASNGRTDANGARTGNTDRSPECAAQEDPRSLRVHPAETADLRGLHALPAGPGGGAHLSGGRDPARAALGRFPQLRARSSTTSSSGPA